MTPFARDGICSGDRGINKLSHHLVAQSMVEIVCHMKLESLIILCRSVLEFIPISTVRAR